jgi:hypothetical protein
MPPFASAASSVSIFVGIGAGHACDPGKAAGVGVLTHTLCDAPASAPPVLCPLLLALLLLEDAAPPLPLEEACAEAPWLLHAAKPAASESAASIPANRVTFDVSSIGHRPA